MRRWFVDPLLAQLKQGAAPEALADAAAAGLLAGTLPFLGLTTALAVVAWKLYPVTPRNVPHSAGYVRSTMPVETYVTVTPLP